MVAAYFVYGTQVFTGLAVENLRYGYFRDGRLGTGAKWFTLCPHGKELREGKRLIACRECGQPHSPWDTVETKTVLALDQNRRSEYYHAVGNVAVFYERDCASPGKYLIGLPAMAEALAVVLWRIVVPESDDVVIDTAGRALHRNISVYTSAGKRFYALEMLAILDEHHGMAASTSSSRSVLKWNGESIDFQTTLRVPKTVDS
ncbi:MAG: hypothetical protein AAB486_03485 [Patescibacteria group bacterium]